MATVAIKARVGAVLIASALSGHAGPKHYTPNELIAAVLVAEAGAETDPRALSAVFEVVKNRAAFYQIPYSKVVVERWQFSCLNRVHDIDRWVARMRRHDRFSEALYIVRADRKTDFTNRADHYHEEKVDPIWARGLIPTARIGRHKFYRILT